MKKYKFNFGVYYKGQEVIRFNQLVCDHTTAAIIVGILDMARGFLSDGYYFACDYTN
jgi:hypothetical protein